MTACLVFNHHSLPFDTVEGADQAVPDFLKICIQSKNAGLSPVLVDETVDPSWFRLELAKGYFWQDWYSQHKEGGSKEMIRAFRSIATQSPFFSMSDMEGGADLLEVSFHGSSNYSALWAAVWHEAPLTSFPSREPWTTPDLPVTVIRLALTSEDITSSEENVRNFYSLSVFEHDLPRLLEQRNARVNSGKTIYENRSKLFPHVIFCGKTQQQLNAWSASVTLLNQVKESLTVLDSFVSRWKNGEYPYYSSEALRDLGINHQVSGESEPVRTTPRLRNDRIFWLPSGRQEFFEDHIKLSNGYRLHFYPDNHEKSIYVGYIGPHLKLK